MLRRHPALGLLSLAQALYWSCSIIGIALTGLMGQKLTPWPVLATLPLTLLVVGNLLAIGRLARWMQQRGRSIGLQRGAALGVLAGLAATAALYLQSFVLFCAAMLLLGGYQASSGFYRFAALDGVDARHKGRAASWVVGGGILAALLAPSLALQAQNWLSVAAAGAYLCIAALAACAALALSGLSQSLFLASSLLLGAGWNLMLLAGTTLLSQAHTPDERAAAQPLMEWSNNGMAAAMSLSCGVLVQTLGWQAINLAALLVIAVLALWMWRSPRAGAAAAV